MSFEGKTLFVTGAGGGIGSVVVELFARANGNVIAVDLDRAAVDAVVERLQPLDRSVLSVQADVADEASVMRAVTEGIARFGAIDCAFNNAGIELEAAPTGVADFAAFERTMAVNVAGVFLCMKHQIAQMLKQPRGGSIVNTASVAGLVGAAGMPGYAASKHAVVGLTRTAAVEYAARGIRVNAVCPGVIRTAMMDRAIAQAPERAERVASLHPMGRIGEPREVAVAALWLLSGEAGFVTGHALAVDGGMTAR